MSTDYVTGGVKVTIGARTSIKLPPRTLRTRLTGMLFESAKTFLLPRAMTGIRQLVRYYHDHPGVDVLVSGHTDTVGPADYNRGLSMERADAIAFYLSDNADEWMKWYAGKACSDAWGVREDQYILQTVRPEPKKPPYYGTTKPINGKLDSDTRDAYKRFQSDHKLNSTSGTPDHDTRKALVTAYMALDGTSLPASAPPPERHGCGLFHLDVPTGGNVDEPRNRRVEVFLFEGGIKPKPTALCKWGGCAEYPQWKANAKETVDLELEPGHIHVSVVDDRGAAVADVAVALSGPSTGDARTDKDGHCEFADLPPGRYTVVAKKDGFLDSSVDVEIKPEIDAHAELTLGRSNLVVFEEGGDPAAGKDELSAADGAALTLRWRVFGDWKKVELRNVALDKTVDVSFHTTELGVVDVGFAPLSLRQEHGSGSTGDGGYRVDMELLVTRPDDSKDKPDKLVVRVQPATASGARLRSYVAVEIADGDAIGLVRRRAG